MEIELRFRRKGRVIQLDGFSLSCVPAAIRPPEQFRGIDLTKYPVIFFRTSHASYRREAKEIQDRAPSAIVAYIYSGATGFGEGILLPSGFDLARVLFFKSTQQLEEERCAAARQTSEALIAEVERTIPGVRAELSPFTGPGNRGVEIYPVQITHANWAVRADTLEEAHLGVAKMRPIWVEWEQRALSVRLRLGSSTGCVSIHPSPTYSERVGLCVSEDQHVVFELQNGEWVETGISSRAFS